MASVPRPVPNLDTVWRASELGGVACRTVPSGYRGLDEELPGAGWPRGHVTEVLQTQPGLHEWRLLATALRSCLMASDMTPDGAPSLTGTAAGPSLSLSLTLCKGGVECRLPHLLRPSDQRSAGSFRAWVEVCKLEGDVERPSTGVGRGSARCGASDLRKQLFVEAGYGNAVHCSGVGALFDEFPRWLAAELGHDFESPAAFGNR